MDEWLHVWGKKEKKEKKEREKKHKNYRLHITKFWK